MPIMLRTIEYTAKMLNIPRKKRLGPAGNTRPGSTSCTLRSACDINYHENYAECLTYPTHLTMLNCEARFEIYMTGLNKRILSCPTCRTMTMHRKTCVEAVWQIYSNTLKPVKASNWSANIQSYNRETNKATHEPITNINVCTRNSKL